MVNAHLEPGYGDFIASKWSPPPPSTPSLNVSNLFINAPPHQKRYQKETKNTWNVPKSKKRSKKKKANGIPLLPSQYSIIKIQRMWNQEHIDQKCGAFWQSFLTNHFWNSEELIYFQLFPLLGCLQGSLSRFTHHILYSWHLDLKLTKHENCKIALNINTKF